MVGESQLLYGVGFGREEAVIDIWSGCGWWDTFNSRVDMLAVSAPGLGR